MESCVKTTSLLILKLCEKSSFSFPLLHFLHILQTNSDNHHLYNELGLIYISYLSLAKTMTSLKRNRCLSLVFAPSVTRTHSSSSSSPFSLVRPRTNGLCSTDTQQGASSLNRRTQMKRMADRDNPQPDRPKFGDDIMMGWEEGFIGHLRA